MSLLDAQGRPITLGPNRLWVVGRDERRGKWIFIGVFTNEQKALEHCRSGNHFLAPVLLDVAFPEEVTEWPGAYYPFK